MIKLVYGISSVLTILILVGVAMFGQQHGWPPVMFMSMVFITIVVMTVLMTIITVLLQRWQKERENHDNEE